MFVDSSVNDLSQQPSSGDKTMLQQKSGRWPVSGSIASSVMLREDSNNNLHYHSSNGSGRSHVLPVVKISQAPKPPKKRFLEAAAAAQQQLEQEQLRQEQQLQQQQQQHLQPYAVGGEEDNSALMQLAEMCVIYQKSGLVNGLRHYWTASTAATACRTPERKTGEAVYVDPSLVSPKTATPSLGWADGPPTVIANANTKNTENEEPLDLSGECTIRANQQDLIDHIVERLCNSSSFPASAKPIQATVLDVWTGREASGDHQVTSTVRDARDQRKDLPLKKRQDPSVAAAATVAASVMVAHCDISSSGDGGDASEPVTSTNGSTKPKQRSCKGKRYLEFVYEGRIALSGRVKRLQLGDSIGSPTRRKSQRSFRRLDNDEGGLPGPAATLPVARGRRSGHRKIS